MQTEALLEGIRAEIQEREDRIAADRSAVEKLREVERLVGELNGGGSVAPSPAPAPAPAKPRASGRRRRNGGGHEPRPASGPGGMSNEQKVLDALAPHGTDWVRPGDLGLDMATGTRNGVCARLAAAGKIERSGTGRAAKLRLTAERAIPGPTPSSGSRTAESVASLEDRIVDVLEQNGERLGDDLHELVGSPDDGAMAAAMKKLLMQKRIARVPKAGRVFYVARS